jgi:DNA-binding Lrp family transcriptional regulator
LPSFVLFVNFVVKYRAMFNPPEVWYHVRLPVRADSYVEDRTMVTAFVLISAKRNMIPETAQALSALEGVAEVHSVAGPFDIVAVIRVRTNEELADLVTGHMLKLKGIERSETLIAFRAFSKFDLERMFSIGMD